MPHIHEKIDFTVEVFIVYDNKVLLRKHDKYKIWLSVGGHIELDEDPNIAAVREVQEEIGLAVKLYHDGKYALTRGDEYKELIPPEFMNRHTIKKDNAGKPLHEHVTLVYFARASTDKLTLSKTEKTEECKWFTRDELEDPQYGIRPRIKMYAKTALEKLVEK